MTKNEALAALQEPIYLGDGVYAMFTGFDIKLWAGEGLMQNTIFLEAAVFANLEEWHKVLIEKIQEFRRNYPSGGDPEGKNGA